ncbi:MAG: phosphomannomutase [Nitrososphaeraceae archaeon]
MKISISGARGIYGSDLDLTTVYRLTQNFISYLISKKKKKKIRFLVAKDSRDSGTILQKIVVSCLIDYGIHVYDLGICPTPVIFKESRTFDGSIIITASHNPIEWNGLKFLIDGHGIFDYDLKSLLNSKIKSSGSEIGKLHKFKSTYNYDISNLLKNNLKKTISKPNIAIDSGGGSASNYAYYLFKFLNYNVSDINCVPGIFSRDPDPTVDPLYALKFFVKSENIDYGFSYDLDGDRLVVITHNHGKLNSDATLLLCICSLIHNFGMKKFVTSIDTSISIHNYLRNHNSSSYYSAVGEANVVEKMLSINAHGGGEGSSAGFIMPDFNMCRDAILAGILISTLDKKLVNDCLNLASKYSQIRTKIKTKSTEHSNLIIDKLADEFKNDSTDFVNLDGIKIILDENSWVLFRQSNTEHVLRISMESTNTDIHSLNKSVIEKVEKVYEKTR